MRRRFRRYRSMAWTCGAALMAAVLIASLAWESQWSSLLVIAHAAAITSAAGATACLLMLHRLNRAAEQVDFSAGVGAYQLGALGEM